MTLDNPRGFPFRNVPDSDLTVATTGNHSVEAIWVFAHGVHTINMPTQGSEERLGKQSLGLDGIQCPYILSAFFERMNVRIEILLHLVNVLSPLSHIIV
jgi:hypothetical protein